MANGHSLLQILTENLFGGPEEGLDISRYTCRVGPRKQLSSGTMPINMLIQLINMLINPSIQKSSCLRHAAPTHERKKLSMPQRPGIDKVSARWLAAEPSLGRAPPVLVQLHGQKMSLRFLTGPLS